MLEWIRSLFFKQEMELTLVGLQNSGKTTLVNVVATGGFSEDMIPTVGFNMRKVTKGKVTIKLWDLGGQPRFRSMWERYCRGVNAIVYVVDSADPENSACLALPQERRARPRELLPGEAGVQLTAPAPRHRVQLPPPRANCTTSWLSLRSRASRCSSLATRTTWTAALASTR